MGKKNITFTKSDGSMAFLMPSEKFLEQYETEEAGLNALIQKDIPEALRSSAKIVENSALPVSRKFRNAWKQNDTAVVEDMTKARAIHLDRIREYRNAELVKEDVNYQRALEANDADSQSAVATKKQTLRDLPATFNLSGATNGAELDALWPSELPERADD